MTCKECERELGFVPNTQYYDCVVIMGFGLVCKECYSVHISEDGRYNSPKCLNDKFKYHAFPPQNEPIIEDISNLNCGKLL